jgi:hypothetical protein
MRKAFSNFIDQGGKPMNDMNLQQEIIRVAQELFEKTGSPEGDNLFYWPEAGKLSYFNRMLLSRKAAEAKLLLEYKPIPETEGEKLIAGAY